MKKITVIILFFTSLFTTAQNVGVGVPNPQNKLHVGGGFRLDTLTGVGGAGLVRHDGNGVVYGIRFSGNSNDVLRGDGSFGSLNINGAIGWLLNGNSGTNPSTNFLGTTDDQPLAFKVHNIRHGYLSKQNIFFGSNAGVVNTGINNIAIGSGALGKNTNRGRLIAIGDSALYNNLGTIPDAASATNNIAIGYKALYSSVDGGSNIAIGANALEKNISYANVGIGFVALGNNVSGLNNVAIGYLPMMNNTSGSSNCALGSGALYNNTTGSENVAIGSNAMGGNSFGSFNTAVGTQAMQSNRQSNNSGFGYRALRFNQFGSENCAFGAHAMENNLGYNNAAFGNNALRNGSFGFNSAFGYSALEAVQTSASNAAVGAYALGRLTTGYFNTAIGVTAGLQLPTNVFNVTCIGFDTGWPTTLSNHINVGNFSVQWIGGQTGWFHYSDKRIKNDIKNDVPGLSFITRLKPITYYVDIDKQEEIANAGKIETNSELTKAAKKDWEGKYDVEKIKMTGFFAQDVEEAAKSINYSFSGVHNPKNGGLLSIDYSAFVVPLVKAVQEQQSIIEKQQKLIDELLKRVTALENK